MNYPKPLFASLLLLSASVPLAGKVTYSLIGGNESWPADKRQAIINAMNEAVTLYNANGAFDKHLVVTYNPGVPTAQAGYGGQIDFGGSIGTRTALHEMGHTMGVGTYTTWNANRTGGVWNGVHAIARVKLFDGASATVGCDGVHVWPYGLNFDNEDVPGARVRHVKMMSALRWDLGIILDSDGDGMPDDWEQFYFGGLGQTAAGDPDRDGVSNLAEYNADTNPKARVALQWAGASGGAWDTASANWSGITTTWPATGVPATGFDLDATFAGVAGVVNVSAGVVVNDITFSVNGYQLQGGPLLLSASSPNSTSGQGPFPSILNVPTGSVATVAAAFAGTDGFVKSGGGILALAGANTVTGTVAVQQGTLTLNSANLPAANTVAVSIGAMVDLNFAGANSIAALQLAGLSLPPGTYNAATHPGYLKGTGSFVVGVPLAWSGAVNGTWDIATQNWANASSTLWVNGADALFGPATATTPNLAANLVARTVTFSQAGYVLSSGSGRSLTLGAISPNVFGLSDATVGVPLVGANGLAKSGAGRLTLTAPASYTGNTTLSAGVLALTNGGALYAGAYNGSAVLAVNTGATLELDRWGYGPSGTAYRVQSLGGLDYNPARFVIDGGTVRFTGGAAGAPQNPAEAPYGPGFTIGAAGATLEAAKVADLWTVKADSRGFGPIANVLGGTLTLTGVGNGRLEKVAPGTGGLVKAGSGTWTLPLANTYIGNTTVTGGVLSLTNGGAIYAGAYNSVAVLRVNAGATLELDRWGYGPSGTAYPVQSLGALDYNPARFVIDGGTVRFTGGAAGAPQNPAEAPYGPGFTIGAAGATLEAAKVADLWTVKADSRGFGPIASTLGGTLTLSGVGNGRLEKIVPGTGGLVKAGAGTWTLPLVNTYTGHTTLNGGILSLTNGGSIYAAANSTAILTVNAGAILELDRWGAGPSGTAYRVQSLGGLAYNPARLVINGGTIRYTGGAAGAPQNPAETPYGPGFTIGAAGATLDAAKIADVWTVKFDSRGLGPITSAAGGTLTLTGSGDGLFDKVLPGTGGLTKTGTGTWTLARVNSYMGGTTVSQGKLVLTQTALDDASTLAVAVGARLALNFTGSDTVAALELGGVSVGPGSYGATHPQYGTYFEGDGAIVVPAPPNPYAAWAATHPGLTESAFDADQDQDGISNGLEWVLGGDPTLADAGAVSPIVSANEVDCLTLVFARDPATTGALIVVVDWDVDLDGGFAHAVNVGATSAPADAQGVIVDIDSPSVGQVTVRIPAANAPQGRVFARLRATLAP